MADAATIQLIRKALQFSYWAAGQGICPVEGEDAEAPEDFFLAYGDEDWETIADRVSAMLATVPPEAEEVEAVARAMCAADGHCGMRCCPEDGKTCRGDISEFEMHKALAAIQASQDHWEKKR